MEDMILDEVRRDVFEHPKPTIDLDYLYSVKKQIQEFADETNTQLKKNVYQNYSLFIESSREISALKEEMRQLNTLLEQQQTSMNKLMDQLNKTPIIQPTLERPKIDQFKLELSEEASEVEAEMLPSWFTKSPEDFDVLIAQRNLREAAELAQRVKSHFEQYPKCCDNNQSELKAKIESRLQELINVICSELQPATARSVQGGPRSSITSIQLLRELNLSSRAVKLYLDQRSSVLGFVLGQQKSESTTTLQFIKQICSIFFHNMKETCNEFKQAFELEKCVNRAIDESVDKLDIRINRDDSDQMLLFDLIAPIYTSPHPPIGESIPADTLNGNDISSQILSHHPERVVENSFVASKPTRSAFYNLSAYASLIYWTVQELENFIKLFRKHVFNNPQLPMSTMAESVHYLRRQCAAMTMHWGLDMSHYIEKELREQIRKIIEENGKKLVTAVRELDSRENWQHRQFQNKAQMTRFFEEMNDVGLSSMPKYIFGDLKLHFTVCKTEFARLFLISVGDLAKLVTAENKDHVDTVLVKAFELEMESAVDALRQASKASEVRFIMGNCNFLFKVLVVANERYVETTRSDSFECKKLLNLQDKYQKKVKSIAKM